MTTLEAQSDRRAAATRGLIAALLAAPLLGVVWFVISASLSFGAGADFGGYGAAPTPPAHGTDIVETVLLLTSVALDVGIGFLTYRHQRRRRLLKVRPGPETR